MEFDCSDIPKLDKTIAFNEKFEEDWRFKYVQKIFYAIGDREFFEYVKQFISTTNGDILKLDKATINKFQNLLPRPNPASQKYIKDALRLMISLLQRVSKNNNLAVVLEQIPNQFLPFTDKITTDCLFTTDHNDVGIISKVFADLTALFFMVQWIEIAAHNPELLPRPSMFYKDGKISYEYDFLTKG